MRERCAEGAESGHFAGGLFEQFVDERLVGLGLPGGHAAELMEQARRDADGNELFSVAGGGPTYATRLAKLFVRGLRDVGEHERERRPFEAQGKQSASGLAVSGGEKDAL
jgi:hypothetical protein